MVGATDGWMAGWRGNEFYLMWLRGSDCACLDGTIDTVNGRRVVVGERGEIGGTRTPPPTPPNNAMVPFAYSAVLIFREFARAHSGIWVWAHAPKFVDVAGCKCLIISFLPSIHSSSAPQLTST